MRILHTADWHLGARSGRIDRSEDLRRAVEQVFGHCERESVDVLLIAGDLFDQHCRNDDACAAIGHLKDAARPFLRSGGTILAVTGNHDGEISCKTLQDTLSLADPDEAEFGGLWAPGRFYLATRPTFCRVADRAGDEVQFVLMPFPTPGRYLDDAMPRHETRDRLLLGGFRETLARIRAHSRFRPDLHSVLAAHLYLAGVTLASGHVIGEGDGVVCPAEDLGEGWAYVALGHVHKPQALGGRDHVRYCGSIERLKIDERHDEKGVVLVEVGPEGRRGRAGTLALEATPFLDVSIARPADELPGLRGAHPEATRALVRCRVAYTPGVDDHDAIVAELRSVFPRCYDLKMEDVSARSPQGHASSFGSPSRDFGGTVLDYLSTHLEGREDAEAILAAATSLIEEARP